MIEVGDVPDYAGLVYVDKSGLITIKKKAPKLHGDKIKDEDLGLGEKFYFNMDSWRSKCKAAWENADRWKEKLTKELEDKGQGRAYKDLENELEGYINECHRLNKEFEAYKAKAHRESIDNSFLIRRLLSEIRKYEPAFDYGKIEDEVFGDRDVKI